LKNRVVTVVVDPYEHTEGSILNRELDQVRRNGTYDVVISWCKLNE